MRFHTLLCILTCLAFGVVKANNGFTLKTVVIDAGHGGKDPGAIGAAKTNEKDIALAVAIKLGEYIKKSYPDVNVIYTRKTDVFLELHERAEIANKAKADLFIAVHCNSSTNAQVYGSSSYILGLHKTEANLDVAKRENAVILLEENRDKNYEFDPNTPEGHIIMSMKQNAFLDQSINFAQKVENFVESYAKRKSLGVKQAGFYVLYKTTMPSMLAEIGFISNPDEEKFLNSDKGQDQLANSLFRAFSEYKIEMEQSEGEQFIYDQSMNNSENSGTTPPATEVPAKSTNDWFTPSSAPVTTTETKPAPDNSTKPAKTTPTATKEEKPVVKEEVKPVVKEEVKPAVKEEVKADDEFITITGGKKIRKPVETASGGGKTPEKPVAVKEVKPAPVENKPVAENKPTPVENKPAPAKTTPAPATTKTEKPAPVASSNTGGVIYKVQLCALKGAFKDQEKTARLFTITTEDLPNGLTRYYGGKANTWAEAEKLLATAKSNGFPTAFIAGFKNGERLGADEMKKLGH